MLISINKCLGVGGRGLVRGHDHHPLSYSMPKGTGRGEGERAGSGRVRMKADCNTSSFSRSGLRDRRGTGGGLTGG